MAKFSSAGGICKNFCKTFAFRTSPEFLSEFAPELFNGERRLRGLREGNGERHQYRKFFQWQAGGAAATEAAPVVSIRVLKASE